MSRELMAAALRYAAAGWPVHPCRPGGKEPLTRWRDSATTSPEIITAWWSRWPTANIGLVTGTPGPDVVDFDVAAGKPGAATLGRLRDTGLLAGAIATVRTPSGGLHVYFAGSEQGNGSLPRHGVDFRGRGGYVVAEPSQVEGRPYELIAYRSPTGVQADWSAIRRFLDPPRPRPAAGRTSRGDHSALVRYVAGLQQGNRNSGLYWAARRAVETAASDDVFSQLIDAATAVGLTYQEAERTVRSARRAGVA